MTEVKVKHAGTWKSPQKIFVKNAGLWKEPVGAYIKDAGTWKLFYPAFDPSQTLDLDFTTGVLDSRITFSRAGTGTYFDVNGVMKYAAHNLMWRSQDFTIGAAWGLIAGATVTANVTTAPDGTTTATRLNHNTAGTVAGGSVNQSVGFSPVDMVLSIYAKAGTKSFLIIAGTTTGLINMAFFNLATGAVGAKGSGYAASGIEAVGDGWYRCWVRYAPNGGSSFYARVGEADNVQTCTSPGDILIWGAQAEWMTTETAPRAYYPNLTSAVVGAPRFDYDPVTHEPLGLLIEGDGEAPVAGSASQDLTLSNWTKTGCTVTLASGTAPDATNTANLVTATASPATITDPMTAATTWCQSAFVKKGTSDWIYFTITGPDAPTSPRVWFNVATGVVGTIETGILTAGIKEIGNGWYRCWAARSANGITGRVLSVGISDADNSTVVTVGKTAYFWGVIIQNDFLYPSSYYPGNRVADYITMTGTNFSDWFNSTLGTFVADFDVGHGLGGSALREILYVWSGSTSNRFDLRAFGTDAYFDIVSSVSPQVGFTLGALVADRRAKAGFSYASNDVAGCMSGGAVLNDTVATIPGTLNAMIIGARSVSADIDVLYGHIRRIQYFNVAKTDAELRALTFINPSPWDAVVWEIPGITDMRNGKRIADASLLLPSTVTDVAWNGSAFNPMWRSDADRKIFINDPNLTFAGYDMRDWSVEIKATAHNAVVRDCLFSANNLSGSTNLWWGAITNDDGAQDVVVEFNEFRGDGVLDAGRGCVYIRHQSGVKMRRISRNRFDRAPNDAINTDGCEVITRNHFYGVGYQNGAHGDLITVQRTVVQTVIEYNHFDAYGDGLFAPSAMGNTIRITTTNGANTLGVISRFNTHKGGAWQHEVDVGATSGNHQFYNEYRLLNNGSPYYPVSRSDGYTGPYGGMSTDVGNPSGQTLRYYNQIEVDYDDLGNDRVLTALNLQVSRVLSASRAGIGSAIIAEDQTGKTRII